MKRNFIKEFDKYLVDQSYDFGCQYIFRFTNDYGASVIKSPGSYGHEQDLWEMALIFFDNDGNYDLTYKKDFEDDVIGYLSNDEVSELLEKIMKY